MQTRIAAYGVTPPDWLSTKRKGPLRNIRAWDFISSDHLAKIPPLSYTALMLARINYVPRLTQQIYRTIYL